MIGQEGLELLVTGMGMVFAFLSLMVAVLYGVAAFFKRFQHLFPDDSPEEAKRERPGAFQPVEPEIAVILAALSAGRVARSAAKS